jgi:hypothetical protein
MILDFSLFTDKLYEYTKAKITDFDLKIFVEEIKKIKDVLQKNNITTINDLMKQSDVSRNKINALIDLDIISKDNNKNFYLNAKRELPPKDKIKKTLKRFKDLNKEQESMKQNHRKEDISALLNKIYKKIKLKGFKYIEKEKLLKILELDEFKGKFDYKFIQHLLEHTPLSEEVLSVSDKSSDIPKMKQIIVYRWRKDDPEPDEKMLDILYKKGYYDKETELDKMKRMETEKTLAAKMAKANRDMGIAGKRLI